MTDIGRASITTYGESTWTLFEDNNLEDSCASANMIDCARPASLNLTRVGSVIRGCNISSKYINYLSNVILQ